MSLNIQPCASSPLPYLAIIRSQIFTSSCFSFFFVSEISHSSRGLISGKSKVKSFRLPSSRGLISISASLISSTFASFCCYKRASRFFISALDWKNCLLRRILACSSNASPSLVCLILGLRFMTTPSRSKLAFTLCFLSHYCFSGALRLERLNWGWLVGFLFFLTIRGWRRRRLRPPIKFN